MVSQVEFRTKAFASMLIASLLATACGRNAGSYPVPEQRSLDLGVDPGGIASFIKMEDPAVNDYIVRDISGESGHFRWAFRHPELRFRLQKSENMRFTAEFIVPEVTFKVTGPFTVTYAVNGNALGAVYCDHAGEYHIAKTVPPAWVNPKEYAHVTFEADHRWVSPEDGAQLSFLLLNAGFQQ